MNTQIVTAPVDTTGKKWIALRSMDIDGDDQRRELAETISLLDERWLIDALIMRCEAFKAAADDSSVGAAKRSDSRNTGRFVFLREVRHEKK